MGEVYVQDGVREKGWSMDEQPQITFLYDSERIIGSWRTAYQIIDVIKAHGRVFLA